MVGHVLRVNQEAAAAGGGGGGDDDDDDDDDGDDDDDDDDDVRGVEGMKPCKIEAEMSFTFRQVVLEELMLRISGSRMLLMLCE